MRYDCALVDTNVLIYCVENSINLLSESSKILELKRIFVPTSVDTELSGLALSNRNAALAIEIHKGIPRISNSGSGDEAIVRAAQENGCAVITNDRELKRKLKDMKIPTYSLRKSGRLEKS